MVYCGTPNLNQNMEMNESSPNTTIGSSISIWCSKVYSSQYGRNFAPTCASDALWELTFNGSIVQLFSINCSGYFDLLYNRVGNRIVLYSTVRCTVNTLRCIVRCTFNTHTLLWPLYNKFI